MIVIMKPHYTPQQLEGVVSVVKQHGLTPHITYGVETAIVAAVGEFHIPSLDPFEILDGVES
ncbi:MAG: 3-deoxy-7-phosphoheptulonate synthase, partial [Anaerolineales bacterium]|nr:3-deoxy-7-phosphoheptulonate synthase [Anaerolineales bacterium]